MKQFLQNQKNLVQNVFNDVYDKYDLMNDFMSLGIHRLWKKDLIMMMSPYTNKKLIDVGCGTGDIGKLFLNTVKFKGREMQHTNLGKELMIKIIEETKDIAKVESQPKFEGKQMVMIIHSQLQRITN